MTYQAERLPWPRWKKRLRQFSMGQPNKYNRDRYPCLLSDSPLTTPSSSPPYINKKADDTSSMLTPLEVRKEDYYTPLSHHKSVQLGDIVLLPPHPPPQRKLTYGEAPVDDFRKDSLGSKRTRAFSEGNINNQTCFICEELLESKLESEKLMSLECGDCIHSECLRTIVDYNVFQALKLGILTETASIQRLKAALLPTCKGHYCSGKPVEPVSPIDDNLIDSIMYDSILTLKLSQVGKSSETLQISLSSTFSTSTLIRPMFNNPTFGTSLEIEMSSKDSVHSLLQHRIEVPFDVKSARYSNLRASRNLTLSVSRPESLAPSNFTNATVSVCISEHEDLSLEYLNNTFIKHMIDSCSTFELSMLVALGQLRLVDKLLVSTDFLPYVPANVYLFANYVVVWETNTPVLLPFTDILSVRTPELSVVEVVFKKGPVISMRLHSNIDSIIEKWGIVIADLSVVVPPEIFSSTMSVYDLTKPSVQVSLTLQEPQETISLETTTIENMIAEMQLIDTSVTEHFVQMDAPSNMLLLPPISPLKIHKVLVYNLSESDSDSDSDKEYIAKVMKRLKEKS